MKRSVFFESLFILVLLPVLEANSIYLFVSGGYSHFDLTVLCVTTSLYIVTLAHTIVGWKR